MTAFNSPAERQHANPEVQKLRDTVEFMDCLSQGGFSEISTIARLVLARLETPDGYQHLDDIAVALRAIWGKADDTENSINGEAGEVGCNYKDDALRRRVDARRRAREADKEVSHG